MQNRDRSRAQKKAITALRTGLILLSLLAACTSTTQPPTGSPVATAPASFTPTTLPSPTASQAATPTRFSLATPTAAQTPALTVSPTPVATGTSAPSGYDGLRALQDVAYQVDLGPRIPGSPAHDREVQWIQTELEKAGWQVEIQQGDIQGHALQNVIAKRGSGSPWTILGAHYDSRMRADQDPDPAKRSLPVPGADDGASGVAVLLELARTLPKDLPGQVWLAFFDIEDQGDLPGWDWILGSRFMAQSLAAQGLMPDAVVVVDMVGDQNLNLPIEQNSNPQLVQAIWSTAGSLGYSAFVNQPGYPMEDDHTPFLHEKMPAVDIIDFDYPYWHTVSDTTDKISADSLKIVGDTLWHWLVKR